MNLEGYYVRIPEGRELEDGYVEMMHGRKFSILLGNDNDTPCDAEVKIDGKDIGRFRINPRSNARLERSPEDSGKFTYYETDSTEGRSVGIADVAPNERGLVNVIFFTGSSITDADIWGEWRSAVEKIRAGHPGVEEVANYIVSQMGGGNDPYRSYGGTSWLSGSTKSAFGSSSINMSAMPPSADLEEAERQLTNHVNDPLVTIVTHCDVPDDIGESSSSVCTSANAVAGGTALNVDSNEVFDLERPAETDRSFSADAFTSGGTGLSGESNQGFMSVNRIKCAEAAEITLRLVSRKSSKAKDFIEDGADTDQRLLMLNILADNSGSVMEFVQAIRDGHNHVLDVVEDIDDSTYVTTRKLYNQIINDGVPISEAERLTKQNYFAEGCTPLNDQTFAMLIEANDRIKDLGDNRLSVTLIITDGLDNDSPYSSTEDIRRLISELTQTGNHVVAAMGVGLSAAQWQKVFADMGISQKWMFTATTSPNDIKRMFTAFSESVVQMVA